MILLVAGLLSLGFLTAVPRHAAAEVSGADSIGIAAYNYFEADFSYTWSSTDCVEGQLYLNGSLQATSPNVCGLFIGETYQGFVFTSLTSGTYTFKLVDTTLGVTVHTRSWSAPGISFTVGVTRTTANVSETVGVEATLNLLAGGPDEYYSEGNLTVSAGQDLSQQVYPQLLGPHYASYYGVGDIPQYRQFTMVVPVSFSNSGVKTVAASYWDPGMSVRGTSLVTISDASTGPTGQRLASLEQNANLLLLLTGVALALAILGFIVGAMGYRAARRIGLREDRGRLVASTPSGPTSSGLQSLPPPVEQAPPIRPPEPPQPPS